MSTNNSKRAYEEVSEDDQYFIDRALEIKARVEKYYDNHPEEYKELLELEEADRLKKLLEQKRLLKSKREYLQMHLKIAHQQDQELTWKRKLVIW